MIDAHYPTVATPGERIQKPRSLFFARAGIVLKVALAIASVVFIVGFAFFTSNITQMAQPNSVPAADAIVVLTGGTDRLKPAIELLKNNSGKKLLISGVNRDTKKEEIIETYAIATDLGACCLDLDRIAANTLGNAVQTAKWLRENNFRSVILVTSNYHMPRAQKELQRMSGNVKITPFPLVYSKLGNWKWLEQPDAFRLILTEYLKYTLATVRHLISGAPSKSTN